MANAYQKKRNKDRKHAALIKRDPTLREQLYGPSRVDLAKQVETLGTDSLLPDWRAAKTRDTAHKRGHEDG